MRITRKSNRSYRIVLADDQVEVRGALRRFIERDGTFVIVAEVENGAEAIETVHSIQPDALIMDLAMPGVDGMTALAEIMRSAPDTRVVVLSSMVSFNGIHAKALALGAIGAYDKYTSPKTVIKALAASLSAMPITEGV
jgi:DNA-binding NarL/FixJ family response regulator